MPLRVVLSSAKRWSVSRHWTLRFETCRRGPAHTRTRVRPGSRPPPRANKPKALSAPLTAELGAKTRRESRAVLLNKTPPCPNKVRFLLTHDEEFWSLLRKYEAKRPPLPRDDAFCGRVGQTEPLLRKKMRRVSEKSRTSQCASSPTQGGNERAVRSVPQPGRAVPPGLS